MADEEQSAAERPLSVKPTSTSPTRSKSGSVSGKSQGTNDSSTGVTAEKPPPHAKEKKGKKGKGDKKTKADHKPSEISISVPTAESTLPEGVVPLFLSSKTQEIFGVHTDIDVTAENPMKIIGKEQVLHDLYNRAAISDFHPVKPLMVDYDGDEILIVYDPEFKHGQNFFIATTEEAKQRLLKGPAVDVEEQEEEEEIEDVYVPYSPPVARPWNSLGSEVDIDEETVAESRKKIVVSVKRIRREFGTPCTFSDRSADKVKDGIIDCPAYEEKSFDLKRMELDRGTQAVPELVDIAVQTNWKYPKNAAVQSQPREFTEEEKLAVEESDELAEFVRNVAQRVESALQQNEILDVFFDDWAALTIDDGSFGSKADNHLKEFQSFTDLEFSKERTITCVDWHPTVKGVVAVSVGERLSFDDRIDNAHKIIMTPSLILVWSFSDPIHPQLLLEAPEDILCFKFCPTDPNIIAGGCISGQVVLWDISQHAERLKQSRSGGTSKDGLGILAGFEDENELQTPIMRYAAVSAIEHSHITPVTDIQWVPDHFEISRMGVPQENTSYECCQLITCATDHSICVWDIRAPKIMKATEEKNLSGIPTTFKHINLTWKPHLKVTLMRSEPGEDYAPTKFSISEVQGDRSTLAEDDTDRPTSAKPLDVVAGEYSSGQAKPQTPTVPAKRTLKNVKTMFYVGTEDGEIVYVDWMPAKDQESGKIQTPKPVFCHGVHEGPIITLQRSPFFRDVVLCIGGWTFSIWKEGVTTSPILRSAASSKRMTAGHWSPSRPSVFYITKQDGSIDIWDLLDRTHEPCMNQSVSPVPITSIYPYQVTSKQHLMAVGDAAGTLHILAIPWSLRQPTPNELVSMSNYIEREVIRRAFVVERWNFREKEKLEHEAEAKKRTAVAPQAVLTDDEQEHRMKLEYDAYLEEESVFLRDLGLLKDELPPASEQVAVA